MVAEDLTWIAIILFMAFLGFWVAGLHAITLFLAAAGVFLLLFLGQIESDMDVIKGVVAIIILLTIPFILFSVDIMRIVYLVIAVVGLLTSVFFYRISVYEVRGVVYAGVAIGLLLMLVGLYLMLF